jgi:hypothetical protein
MEMQRRRMQVFILAESDWWRMPKGGFSFSSEKILRCYESLIMQ